MCTSELLAVSLSDKEVFDSIRNNFSEWLKCSLLNPCHWERKKKKHSIRDWSVLMHTVFKNHWLNTCFSNHSVNPDYMLIVPQYTRYSYQITSILPSHNQMGTWHSVLHILPVHQRTCAWWWSLKVVNFRTNHLLHSFFKVQFSGSPI